MAPPLIVRLLIQEEGSRLEPYKDHFGYWTVGVGHLIDRRKGGLLPPWVRPSFPLDPIEVDQLLLRDIAEKERALFEALPWFLILDEVRRTVLLSMAFQMGVDGLLEFRQTLAAFKDGRWSDAADGMRASLWYRQTPGRAERLARAVTSGAPEELRLT